MLGNHFHKGKVVDPESIAQRVLKGIFVKFHNDLKTKSLFAFDNKGKSAKRQCGLTQKNWY